MPRSQTLGDTRGGLELGGVEAGCHLAPEGVQLDLRRPAKASDPRRIASTNAAPTLLGRFHGDERSSTGRTRTSRRLSSWKSRRQQHCAPLQLFSISKPLFFITSPRQEFLFSCNLKVFFRVWKEWDGKIKPFSFLSVLCLLSQCLALLGSEIFSNKAIEQAIVSTANVLNLFEVVKVRPIFSCPHLIGSATRAVACGGMLKAVKRIRVQLPLFARVGLPGRVLVLLPLVLFRPAAGNTQISCVLRVCSNSEAMVTKMTFHIEFPDGGGEVFSGLLLVGVESDSLVDDLITTTTPDVKWHLEPNHISTLS
mmetsp:Transcript_86389/g.230775  ORF Transcript_86389/g.230775 Transcript_86389/m.230775 type:complete len:310 (-) Transcript_86389:133-1062(-)